MLAGTMLDALPQHERLEIARLWEKAERARQTREFAAADDGFKRLGCFLPAVAEIQVRLASTAAALERHRRAASDYGRAAILSPGQSDLVRAAAEHAWLAGDRDMAGRLLARSLREAPLDVAGWRTRTQFCRELGNTQGAASALRRALLLQPDDWQLACQTGMDLAAANERDAAIVWQRRALRLAPDEALPRSILVEAVRAGVAERQDSPLRRDLLDVTEKLRVRPRGLVRTLLILIRHEPAFEEAAALLSSGHGPFDLLSRLIDESGLPRLLGFEILPDQQVENVLAALRGRALTKWSEDGLGEEAVDLLQALAAHCQLHEYCLAQTKEETAQLEQLRTAAISADARGPLVLLACYEPIGELWQGRPDLSGRFEAFGRRHVEAPRRIREAAERVERMTELSPGVSEAVGRQYEEDPYPRWIRPPGGGGRTLRARLRKLFPSRAGLFGAALERPEVLIAGCGTGQEACALAAGYPDARITAVDLSRASLGYARCKAEEFGLGNVSFGQADILKLGELGRRFDFIESVGVLHHMEHPEAGLGVLASLLRSGGVMHLGFYSRRGRVAVNAARALIDEWGLEPSPAGIREARQRLFALREERPDLGGLFVSPDFYARPSCRDLIFHVQEHQYDVPGLRALADGAGLSLLGFELQADRRAAYRAQFPEDAEVRDWEKVDAFEQGMPWAFSEMYRFWLIKP